MARIAIFSILPLKDLECQKFTDETKNYLKDYVVSFIDNSNITEN